MLRLLLLALALAPAAARAQLTITETGDEPDEIVNIAECKGENGADSDLAFEYTLSGATSVELRVSDTSDCPVNTDTTTTTAKTEVLDTFTGTRGNLSLAATDVLSRVGIDTSQCETGANKTIHVCAVATGTTTANKVVGSFLLDRTRPPTPSAPSVSPGENALDVSWTAVSGSRLSYRAEATPQGGGNVSRSSEQTGTSVRIEGLTIGTTYDVVVVAISEGGNESDPSPATAGVPVDVIDFWDGYQGAGGGEEGGCSTGPAGALALLVLVPLALRRRRS